MHVVQHTAPASAGYASACSHRASAAHSWPGCRRTATQRRRILQKPRLWTFKDVETFFCQHRQRMRQKPSEQRRAMKAAKKMTPLREWDATAAAPTSLRASSPMSCRTTLRRRQVQEPSAWVSRSVGNSPDTCMLQPDAARPPDAMSLRPERHDVKTPRLDSLSTFEQYLSQYLSPMEFRT